MNTSKEYFTFNTIPDRPDLWIIESIKHPDGTDRTDGRYPIRIGCIAVILFAAEGRPLYWSYVADSDGGEKKGVMRSGAVLRMFYDSETETLHAESPDSRYAFRKLPQKWGEIYADRGISLPDSYPDYLGAVKMTVLCGKFEVMNAMPYTFDWIRFPNEEAKSLDSRFSYEDFVDSLMQIISDPNIERTRANAVKILEAMQAERERLSTLRNTDEE